MKNPKQLFTVLMMLPDYIASNYGQETYLSWVEATNASTAETAGQREAQSAFPDCDDVNDFFVVFVAHGHIDDVKNGD